MVLSRLYIGPEINKDADVGALQMQQAPVLLGGDWGMLRCEL